MMKIIYVLSKMISFLFYPFIVIPLTFVILIAKSDLILNDTLLWVSIMLGVTIIPTFIYVIIGRVRGKYSDWDVSVRGQRSQLYRVGLMSVFGLLLINYVFKASDIFKVLSLAGFISLAISMKINQTTKISIHSLVFAGSSLVLILFGNLSMAFILLLIVLVFIVGWSRVIIKSHTSFQVLLGILVGYFSIYFAFVLVTKLFK